MQLNVQFFRRTNIRHCIRLSQKFYRKVADAQHFLFYIILLNYVWSILFYYGKMAHT